MEKIPTIFDRDWEGHRGVIDVPIVSATALREALATEKLDGTNVRLTVRNQELMRLEKRRNPSPRQKAAGITDPWYVDADADRPADRALWEAARNTDLRDRPDGEWSGEAVGPKLQGNPLALGTHTVYLFSLPSVRFELWLPHAPTTYAALRDWLPEQRSTVNADVLIEGIVWWHPRLGVIGKIKAKDFKAGREESR